MAGGKLSDKAAKLDFSKLPAALPGVGGMGDAAGRPKTAPGAMMAFANDSRSELLKENEQLRQRAERADALRGQLDEAVAELVQWEGAKAARLLDSQRVRPSSFANRHESNFEGPEYQALKREIEGAGGNVQPIKVRALRGGEDDGALYEVVFGHRRHRACLELGLPVLAVVDNLDDRTLFVEMERENRQRKDLSAWEQGRMYRRALQAGLFPSNRKLAEAIGVDLSALGKALALADLPEALVAAFPSPLALQFRWAKPLADAFSTRPAAVLARAQDLAARRGELSGKAVFEALIAEEGRGVERFHPQAPIQLRAKGRSIGRVAFGADGELSVVLSPGVVSAERVQALVQVLEGFAGSAHGPSPKTA